MEILKSKDNFFLTSHPKFDFQVWEGEPDKGGKHRGEFVHKEDAETFFDTLAG